MYRLAQINPATGKNITVHRLKSGMNPISRFQRPCQQCVECRLAHSRRIAVRCVHEASMHDHNSFLTLTHNDETLPDDLSLSTRTMQLFWKKLRKKTFPGLKYYAAGEYGDGQGERPINPHYHAALFGYDFPDKKYHKTKNGHKLYVSDQLNETWGLGNCLIGNVTFESAAYVARYCLKKYTNKNPDLVDAHYSGRLPEQSWSSTGLGAAWFDKWHSDIYPADELIIRGQRMSPPPYYDKLLLAHDPELYEIIKQNRQDKKIIDKNNYSLERLYKDGKPVTMNVSEMVLHSQLRSGKLDQER